MFCKRIKENKTIHFHIKNYNSAENSAELCRVLQRLQNSAEFLFFAKNILYFAKKKHKNIQFYLPNFNIIFLKINVFLLNEKNPIPKKTILKCNICTLGLTRCTLKFKYY
jgi:hypothetical protein